MRRRQSRPPSIPSDGIEAISYGTGVAAGRPIRSPKLGDTWLVITERATGVVVGCPGCGTQRFFEAFEEPATEHASVDCPVFRLIAGALRHFHQGGKSCVV